MSEGIVSDIRARTRRVLEAIERTLAAVSDDTMRRPPGGWPVWRQFYHLLYWLDYWFVDPLAFRAPGFHQDSLLSPEAGPEPALSKQELRGYHIEISARVFDYLDRLTESELCRLQTVRGGNRSRLDMMLGQFVHVYHHLGYICATVRTETGHSIWEAHPASE